MPIHDAKWNGKSMININPCNSYKLVDMSGAADFSVANQIHTGKMQMAPDVDVEELVNTKDDTAVDLTQGGGAGRGGLVAQTLEGPLSTLSKPIFAIEGSFCSSFQNLQDRHAFARRAPLGIPTLEPLQIHI